MRAMVLCRTDLNRRVTFTLNGNNDDLNLVAGPCCLPCFTGSWCAFVCLVKCEGKRFYRLFCEILTSLQRGCKLFFCCLPLSSEQTLSLLTKFRMTGGFSKCFSLRYFVIYLPLRTRHSLIHNSTWAVKMDTCRCGVCTVQPLVRNDAIVFFTLRAHDH